MKKYLVLTTIAIMSASLVACGTRKAEEGAGDAPTFPGGAGSPLQDGNNGNGSASNPNGAQQNPNVTSQDIQNMLGNYTGSYAKDGKNYPLALNLTIQTYPGSQASYLYGNLRVQTPEGLIEKRAYMGMFVSQDANGKVLRFISEVISDGFGSLHRGKAAFEYRYQAPSSQGMEPRVYLSLRNCSFSMDNFCAAVPGTLQSFKKNP